MIGLKSTNRSNLNRLEEYM